MKSKTWLQGIIIVAGFAALAGVCYPAWAVDTTPPTGSIVINNNRSATNSANVTLTLTWNDGTDGSGVSRIRFSDDGSHWSGWEVLAATRAYTLPAGADGHRTVRVQFLDKANNRSLIYSDYIRLDTTLPTGTIIINCGGGTTVPSVVHLGLTWSDSGSGVSRTRFSDNGSTWTPWTPIAAESAHHKLLEGQGYRTVRVQFLDGAGNYSIVYSDYIKVVAPTEETVMLPGDVPLVLVKVTGGSFMMGRYPEELGSDPSEDPQHQVTLGSFWMGKYELTKRQWQAVMNTAPWTGQTYVLSDPDSAAVYVSWNDCQAFVATLNTLTGRAFQLPSESQWEYACRAGMTTRFYWGDDPGYTAIGDFAWFDGNRGGDYYARLVGQKTANPIGLFDMSGNVWEWCQDNWGSYTLTPTDGSAYMPDPGYYHVPRGGAYNYGGYWLRSAQRGVGSPSLTHDYYGLRVVRTS